MYKYKLDVFIAPPAEPDGGLGEPLAMSFLLTQYDYRITSPENLERDPLAPDTEEEWLEELVCLLPQAELAQIALALQLGRETKSSRLVFEGKDLSQELVDRLTDSTKRAFWSEWSQEVVVPAS